MERDCESELSKLNIEQNACIYHFGASVIHGQRSNILRLHYICADAEELFYHDFYAKILAKHHIHSILNTIPDGIEVTSRTDDDYEYIFIQNFSYRNIDIVLPKKGDIIYGNKNGNIRQYETIVFRKKLF